ncbi:transcriptional regulator, LacI family [Acetanaerobacterium elongatum]|uniref:Transcriptional regulator, LacI family n=2 Tax=Acetanaerobacterium elongatum TaxID=258515 RepID=A0A1G9W301_9FIRM|nr:transcriptional regulator, LacI family [Acetanaerobacterium elongatum]
MYYFNISFSLLYTDIPFHFYKNHIERGIILNMSVTIKDIAREAGVSVSTVSKVINGSSSISEATIQRVQYIMKLHNYYPNQRARSFAQQATHNVVFISRLERDIAFTNPHMFEILCGVQKALGKKDYALTLCGVGAEDDEIAVMERIIAQKSADGIMIHGSAISTRLAELMNQTGFPHIVIGKPDFDSQLCWIDINNYLSGEIATKHLYDCGRRSLAFIAGHLADQISAHRLQGFRTTLVQKGLPVNPDFIRYTDSTKDGSFDVMKELLSAGSLPDGVVCENNSIALGVVKAIKAARLSIPDDIAVIGFDDYPFSRIVEPMLSVVNIDVYDMGLQAGSLLVRKIKNPMLQIQSYTTLPQLMVRASTAKE